MKDMDNKIKVTSCGCCIIKYIDDLPCILLVRPFVDNDTWGIPKGHINPGETHEECAQRETFEEVGLTVSLIEKLSPVKTTYRNECKTVFSFLSRQLDSNDVPFPMDGENADVRWFPLTQLPTIHVYQRNLMKEVATRVALLPRGLFNG